MTVLVMPVSFVKRSLGGKEPFQADNWARCKRSSTAESRLEVRISALMKPSKFLVGMTAGITLVLAIAGAFLFGIAGFVANAASNRTPVATVSSIQQPVQKTPAVKNPSRIPHQQTFTDISDAEWSAAAAELGVSVDELQSALGTGKSVADLGAANDVTVQQIKDAMVAAGRAKVSSLLQAGTITQPQADNLDQTIVVAIADKLTHISIQQTDGTAAPAPSSTDAKNALQQKMALRQADPGVMDAINTAELDAAAQTLGLSDSHLKTALGSPGALGSDASSQHVTAQQVKDAMIAAGQTALNAAVQAGTITQSEADQLQNDVVQPLAEKIYHVISNALQATPSS